MSPALTKDLVRERLYALLPTIYRMRDFGQGEPLRALLLLLENELLRVESDIARLYDNWFVETCDEWAVPYIGDLIGSRLLHPVHARAFTANSLAHKRRSTANASRPCSISFENDVWSYSATASRVARCSSIIQGNQPGVPSV